MAYQNKKQTFDPVPKVPAHEQSKFQLTAKKLEGGDYPPKLTIKFWGANPRLDFRAGFKYGNGGEGTYFAAKMDVPVMCSMFKIIKEIAENSAETVDQIAITCGEPKEGGKPWDVEFNVRVYIGKDSNGVYINPVAKRSPYNVKFYIIPTIYHKFIDSNNNPLSNNEMARRYASTWAESLNSLILSYLHETSYRSSLGENNLAKAQSSKKKDDTSDSSNSDSSDSSLNNSSGWQNDDSGW
jgi:hypothetical protein